MLELSKHPLLKYPMFASMYFAEGIQFALVTLILVMYFDELDISISTTTIISGLAASPFILKFLIGPITDYFNKHGRKPFIIIGGLVGSICIFPLAYINPKSELILFTILFFISHLGVIFLDVSADAWAIQITKPNERGKVNSAMFGGLFAGLASGTLILSLIAEHINFEMTFIVTGFIIILTIILPLLVREIKTLKIRPKIGKLLVFEFKKKNTILIALFGMVSAANYGIILLILPDYMINVLGLDLTHAGGITTLSNIGIIAGAIIGGILADRFGRKKTLYTFFIGAAIFSALLITANTWQILTVIYIIFGFFTGGSTFAALMALYMDITNPKIGATQFSILTSIANFGEIGIGIFSGTLLIMLGYHRLFLYAAWIIGPSLVILYFIEEKK